jgi:hypothetical protein
MKIVEWVRLNCRFAMDPGWSRTWHRTWEGGEGIGESGNDGVLEEQKSTTPKQPVQQPQQQPQQTNRPQLVYHYYGFDYPNTAHGWNSILWMAKGGQIFDKPARSETGTSRTHEGLGWVDYDWKGRYEPSQGVLTISGDNHPPPNIIDALAAKFPNAKVFHLFGIEKPRRGAAASWVARNCRFAQSVKDWHDPHYSEPDEYGPDVVVPEQNSTIEYTGVAHGRGTVLWAMVDGEILIEPDSDAMHEDRWPEMDWKGRYEPETGDLSITSGIVLGREPPPAVVEKLRQHFKPRQIYLFL